jgi:hypothetical protein
VLCGFVRCLRREEIDPEFAARLLPPIANAIAAGGFDRGPFIGALAALARRPEVAEAIRCTAIPRLLRESLARCHDNSVPDVYDCVYYLTKHGEVPDEFTSESFAASTIHFLARGNKRDALSVLRAVGALARSCGEVVFARGIIAAVAELIQAAPFEVRRAALCVVLEWLSEAPHEAAAQILARQTVDAMCAVAAAGDAQDVLFFLETCARLDAQIVRAMAERDAFVEFLEGLGDCGENDVGEYVEELWAIVEDAGREPVEWNASC